MNARITQYENIGELILNYDVILEIQHRDTMRQIEGSVRQRDVDPKGRGVWVNKSGLYVNDGKYSEFSEFVSVWPLEVWSVADENINIIIYQSWNPKVSCLTVPDVMVPRD